MNHLLDHEIDLTHSDARFRNDVTCATANPPAMLLKVVQFAYSQGIISSRDIESACQQHVTFIALSGETAPHFTTLVSILEDDIEKVFSQALFICDRLELMGREMLPSTA